MKRILLTLAAAGAALALAAGGAWAAGNGPEIKGTLQTIYTVPGSRAASSFSVKMARVLFSGAAGPDWSYAVLLDAVRQPALLEAHLDFSRKNLLPEPFGFRFRAGQFRVPFSMESLAPDGELETVNRSQVVDALAPGRDTGTKGRDAGASLQLTASPPDRKRLVEATAGVFNGEGANTADKNKRKGYAARAVLYPAAGVSFGVSYYDGTRYSTSTVTDRAGAEAALAFGGFSLKGEYIRGRDGAVRREGWYAQAGAFVLPKALQAVAKYDIYDPDVKKSEAASSAAEKKTAVSALGVNWYFAEGMRLQADYEWKYRTGGGILCNTFNAVLSLTF